MKPRSTKSAGSPGRPAARAPKAVAVPADLASALSADGNARAAWAALAPSHRREHTKWIGEAKRPETRARRVAQAVARLRDGRSA